MNRALPLAVLLSATLSAPAFACANGAQTCGAGGAEVPTNGHGGTGGSGTTTSGGGSGTGFDTNSGGTAGTSGTGGSGGTSGTLNIVGPASNLGLNPQLTPAARQQILCTLNPAASGCPQAAQDAAAGQGGAAAGGSQTAPPPVTPQANGARAVGANTNWAPTDLAKLQGGGSDQNVDSGEGRAAMLAAMLASSQRPAATPGQDPFGKGVVQGIPPAGAGLQTPHDRANELLGSSNNKLKLGDYVGALRDAQKAIELDPDNSLAHLKAAEALNHIGRFGEAETEAREALKRDPNNAQAWKNLAWALLKQGKYQEALEAALTAVKLRPDFAEAWAIAAFAAERLHDNAARLTYLQKAAALNSIYQSRLDAVNAGGSAYADDDDLLVGGAKAAPGAKVPWGAVAGGAGGLLLLGVAAGLLARRRKSAAAAPRTLVQLRPPTPAIPRAPRMESPSGAGVVIGKYELAQVIGRGGMGEVYEAKDLSLGRPVAIKKMTAGFEELGEQARALFIKEARTVAQLHHPAIVDIYEILEQGKDLYLVFEYVKGKTTQQLLAETGRLPLKRAADILKPVCDALQFAHNRAMVHRDLKPANIMITDHGHVKLMDFGIARSLRDAVETQLGVRAVATAALGSARTATVVGTPVYMAPEAELGVVCKEGDVYALGVTLYELLTGRLPFSSHAMAQEKATLGFAKATAIAGDLPPAVDALIEGALQPRAELRLKTPADFIQHLTAAAR